MFMRHSCLDIAWILSFMLGYSFYESLCFMQNGILLHVKSYLNMRNRAPSASAFFKRHLLYILHVSKFFACKKVSKEFKDFREVKVSKNRRDQIDQLG